MRSPRKESVMSDKHTTDTERAAAMAAGLRELAAMVTDHPHLADNLRCGMRRWLVSVGHGGADARAQVIAFARAGRACGATVTEHDDGHTYAGVDVAFGPAVNLHVYAAVEKVHGVTRRNVEQGENGTCRITEYTPRSILSEIDADAGERAA
jgi:hypothetical protein